MRILVVDDETVVREVVRRMVEAMGHEAVCASSVAFALFEMALHPVEMVITDLQMDGESGLDLCRAMNRLLGDERPYVLMVTGSPALLSPYHQDRSMMDAYLAKPISFSELKTHVQRARERAARGALVSAIGQH
jgi:DNA-binding response OmpR family regulator